MKDSRMSVAVVRGVRRARPDCAGPGMPSRSRTRTMTAGVWRSVGGLLDSRADGQHARVRGQHATWRRLPFAQRRPSIPVATPFRLATDRHTSGTRRSSLWSRVRGRPGPRQQAREPSICVEAAAAAVAQFETGGGSNNASSAASGAWKMASHSSKSARPIGSLSQGGAEFRASIRRQSSSVGTSR
jgi:hypothetical protein